MISTLSSARWCITGGCYHLGVGGGITCESESEFEYEETLQKAKALIEALRLA